MEKSPYGNYGAALLEASLRLFRQADRAGVIEAMFDFLEKNAKSVHLSLYIFSEGNAKLVAGRGLHEKLVGRVRAINKGEFNEMLNTGKTWAHSEYQKRRLSRQPLPSDMIFSKAHECVEAIVVLPFSDGEKVIGSVGIDYDSAGLLPDGEQLQMLEQYAAWAGIAYENARINESRLDDLREQQSLCGQLEQKQAMLSFLHEASLSILHHLDMKAMLEGIIAKGAEYTGADGAYVFLPSGNADELERMIAIGAASASLGLRIGRGEGAAGKAWSTNEMIVDNSYRASPVRLAACSQVEAVINFPLRRGTEAVGVVGFWHIHSGEKFWEKDVQALRRLAELSSLAYDHACLYEEVKAELASREKLEEEIRHMAFHDALTGLPNRRLLEDRLNQAISQARRFNETVAVMFLDLDGMKLINDSFGHETGDHLLEAVAERLRAAVRDIDTVARISGDEFVLVLPRQESRALTGELAERILDAIRLPFALERTDGVGITASIGIGFFPEDGTDYPTLLRSADKAMYLAKQLGRDQWVFARENAAKL